MYTGSYCNEVGNKHESQQQKYSLFADFFRAEHMAQVLSNPSYNGKGNQNYETSYKKI